MFIVRSFGLQIVAFLLGFSQIDNLYDPSDLAGATACAWLGSGEIPLPP